MGSAPCSIRLARMRGSAGQNMPHKVAIIRAMVLLCVSGSGLLKDAIWLSWSIRTVLLQLLSLVSAPALVWSCSEPVQGPRVTKSQFCKKRLEQVACFCWFSSLNSGVCQVPVPTHGRGWELVAKGEGSVITPFSGN